MFQKMLKHPVLLLSLFLAFAGHALATDKGKVIQITADSANLDQHTHQGTYMGKVILIQGSSRLQASKAMTQGNNKNQLILATATGSKEAQAHYQTQTTADKAYLHAYANSIRYYPMRHLVELIGNAHIIQGRDTLSAEKISYDTLKKQVISQGNGKKRISIIYHSEEKSS